MTFNSTNNPEINEPTTSTDFPVRGWWKIFYAAFLIVVPSFSFFAVEALKPEWQSGDWDAYITLLLQAEASILFLILLAYSILCYLLLLLNANRFAGVFVVRLGIYTGVLLALQYTILLGAYLFRTPTSVVYLLVWFFPLYFPKFYRKVLAKWVARYIRPWMIAILLIAYAVIAYFIKEDASIPLFLVFLGVIASGPFWSFLIAVQASIWLLQYHETGISLLNGLGVIAWLAAYVAAWKYDILKMYEMYAALPLVPPDCYIATAAAHGHPNFVGSKTIRLASGQSMQVNRQLQVFKCAELALMAVAPNAHKILRKVYDSIGKPLAWTIQHPLLADAAYLLLKPFEWAAGSILKRLVPEISSISIYKSPSTPMLKGGL
ncbi:MAG: hypothetical protein IT314_08500 [Anaerolineales bacterium]|nr:hypothetical protein [Anaerolineales bacterium]